MTKKPRIISHIEESASNIQFALPSELALGDIHPQALGAMDP
jgi:hypothetical protein